jgi:hypothetical protein
MLGVYSGLHTSGLDDCAITTATRTPMMANEIVNGIAIRRYSIIYYYVFGQARNNTDKADHKMQN